MGRNPVEASAWSTKVARVAVEAIANISNDLVIGDGCRGRDRTHSVCADNSESHISFAAIVG